MTPKPAESVAGSPVFVTTHWSVVLTARQPDAPQACQALATLCQTYWHPLYAFVRRRGYSVHDAEDLTQEFFARFLERRGIEMADPQRGRFRSFLLASLKNFLANQWDRAQAQKRGGGQFTICLDTAAAETFYGREPASTLTPETLFDRHFALALLDRALTRLEQEAAAARRGRQFELLKQFLTSPPPEKGYDAVALELQMAPGSVAVAVHRLRSRFRELMREEVAETLASPADVQDELRHLCEALLQDAPLQTVTCDGERVSRVLS